MTEAPAMKYVDMQQLVGAQVTEHDFGLPTDKRCVRCDAQAYVEIEVYDAETGKKRVFEMCAHHYKEHEDKLRATATRIADHRPYLLIEEAAARGIDSR